MSFFTDTEKYVAEKLINTSFERAAHSFSSLLKQDIVIEMTDISISREMPEINMGVKQAGELTLVITEIMGELDGKSYLVFNEEECEALYHAIFPKNDNPKDRSSLEEAFLKEVDNILSASVITEFSNFFNIQIYGDVPHLIRINHAGVGQIINQDFNNANTNSAYFFIANTKFLFKDNLQLRPHFFWKFNEKFMDLIKMMDISK